MASRSLRRPRSGRRRTSHGIPLGPLQAFHLTAQLGRVSAAARALGITQPAVTQQIRRQEAVENLVGVQRGHLRVGASRTAGSYYIAGLLDRFKRRFPGVRVSLSVGNSETILERILGLALDLGLIAGPCADPRLVAVPLIRDRLLVIMPPGHPLSAKPVVSMEDLAGYPWISREPGSATRRLIEGALASHGVQVEPTMELESNEAIKSAVADGIGIGLMARAAVAGDVDARRLVARPLRESLTLDFFLVYHRERTIAPAVAAFLELVSAAGGHPLRSTRLLS